VLRSTVCGRLGGGVVELHIFIVIVIVIVVFFFLFFNDLYGALFVFFLFFEVALERERHEGLVEGAHSALHRRWHAGCS
jgi:hypothetical protein